MFRADSALIPSTDPVIPVIPVYQPDLSGNERRYVLECLDSGWVSSLGSFIGRFEAAVAASTGGAYATAVCNGTAALHTALHALGVGPGDEVIVPTFTYIASVNTIAQTGATPVFAECRGSDWLLDPADVERRITTRTKAIMPVHLFGAACDLHALGELADEHGLRIVEDCAEALGTTLHDRHVGTFGDVGTFSFFGNKTVTTGEGGMLITNDKALEMRMRAVSRQGQSLVRRYWHETLGFNYRMTNIAAAIGLAQMERLDAILARKRAIGQRYRALLTQAPVTFQQLGAGVVSSDWLVSCLLPAGTNRDQLIADLAVRSVDTRPVFYCAHRMPMYEQIEQFAISENISARGLSLPSYPSMSDGDVERVAGALQEALHLQRLL